MLPSGRTKSLRRSLRRPSIFDIRTLPFDFPFDFSILPFDPAVRFRRSILPFDFVVRPGRWTLSFDLVVCPPDYAARLPDFPSLSSDFAVRFRRSTLLSGFAVRLPVPFEFAVRLFDFPTPSFDFAVRLSDFSTLLLSLRIRRGRGRKQSSSHFPAAVEIAGSKMSPWPFFGRR